MDLREVQSAQARYDQDHWSHEAGAATICHSERHIAKLCGKIATIAEQYDHGETPDLSMLDDEVIPDLLIFAARLANDRGLDLETALRGRTEQLEERYRKAGTVS